MAEHPPCLVLAIGNPSRGDDAFGPWMAERLLDWLSTQGTPQSSCIDVIVEQQCMVEHVLDLQGRQRILFIDAAASGPQHVSITPVTPMPSSQAQVHSHACTPAQLLALHAALLQSDAPPADLLSVVGHDFELGAPLSEAVRAQLDDAWALLHSWISRNTGHA